MRREHRHLLAAQADGLLKALAEQVGERERIAVHRRADEAKPLHVVREQQHGHPQRAVHFEALAPDETVGRGAGVGMDIERLGGGAKHQE